MTILSLRRFLRYARRFGIRAGWQAARLHGAPGQLVTIRLPQLGQPMWARTGTSDAATFDEIFMAGEYDLPFADLRPDRILDLGANIGFASVYFAARWPGAYILSVEPAGPNLELLRRNTRGWPGIEILPGAVWARAGRVAVANPAADANAFRMAEDEAGVEAYTVDQLIEHQGGGRVGVLKLDVEGAEAEIFRSGSRWLDRVDVLVVELHDRIVPGCGEALRDALRGRRFRQEVVGGNLAFDLRAGQE